MGLNTEKFIWVGGQENQRLGRPDPEAERLAVQDQRRQTQSEIGHGRRREPQRLQLPPGLGDDPAQKERQEDDDEAHARHHRRLEDEVEDAVEVLRHEEQRELGCHVQRHDSDKTALEDNVSAAPGCLMENV